MKLRIQEVNFPDRATSAPHRLQFKISNSAIVAGSISFSTAQKNTFAYPENTQKLPWLTWFRSFYSSRGRTPFWSTISYSRL